MHVLLIVVPVQCVSEGVLEIQSHSCVLVTTGLHKGENRRSITHLCGPLNHLLQVLRGKRLFICLLNSKRHRSRIINTSNDAVNTSFLFKYIAG